MRGCARQRARDLAITGGGGYAVGVRNPVSSLPLRPRRACGAGVLAALAAGILLAAPTARADYGAIRRVVNGSAWTLEQGELAVGIVSPLQYGLLDELTLATHPVLDLLLTPNVALKGKVLDQGPVALSLNASYIQTFLRSSSADVPGSVSAWPSLSIALGDAVSLTAQGGYVMDIAPLSHGASMGLAASFLLGPADLVQISVVEQWFGGGRGWQIPTAVLTYGHAWYRLRLTVGIAAGRFPLQIGSGGAKVLNLPVYPVIDVWWLL